VPQDTQPPLTPRKVTDSIPRARIADILGVLAFVASSGRTTFEQIRLHLLERSKKVAPASRWALGTVARDIVVDLQKLGLVDAGTVPRTVANADRLGDAPCEVTEKGRELASQPRGHATDQILIAWMSHHPYFRALIDRLHQSALYVPDVTSVKQIGADASSTEPVDVVANRITENCLKRLAAVGFSQTKAEVFDKTVRDRVGYLRGALALSDLDTKKWVDTVQDKVVLPAFLSAENLSFDPVTFQHLLKTCRDFYAASWTTSHPDYALRVIFLTCDFIPNLAKDLAVVVTDVAHHGKTFARERFSAALKNSYKRLEVTPGAYVDAYKLRALVCIELGVQPGVFAACLNELIKAGPSPDLTIYTELPFDPPPHGEDHLELDRSRIGLIKLVA